jgi:ribosomal protein L37AE/L43A
MTFKIYECTNCGYMITSPDLYTEIRVNDFEFTCHGCGNGFAGFTLIYNEKDRKEFTP